jgi:hypothetical protein
VHSIFENGSEGVSALIFFLMSGSLAKLKILMSVEHIANVEYPFHRTVGILVCQIKKGFFEICVYTLVLTQ